MLVFSHSLLDGTVFDCCLVTTLAAPRDWEQDLKGAQVPLLEIHSKSYDQLLGDKLAERLDKLERESLLTKIDRLFSRCQPPPRWSPAQGYMFDRERVKRFDDQRHEIIHGQALGNPLQLFPVSDENLFYIQQTGLYFIALLNRKYHLRIDPQHIEKTMRGALDRKSPET